MTNKRTGAFIQLLGNIMDYSDRQYKHGFWGGFANKQFGSVISELSEFKGEKFLRLACTQLPVNSDKEKRRILKEWIEALPTLDIEFLQLQSHVPEKLIESVSKNTKLKGLYIKWTKAKSISPIANMNNLKYLHIGSGAGIIDIDQIRQLGRLKVLTLENIRKTQDYSFLKSLGNLEFLSIEGGLHSVPVMDGLDSFIGHLINLKFLHVIAIRCPKPKIEEIKQLKKLVSLLGTFRFTDSELVELKKTLTDLKYDQIFYDQLQRENFPTMWPI